MEVDGESSKTESRSDSYERTEEEEAAGFVRGGRFVFGVGPRMGVVLVETISYEPRLRIVVVVRDMDLSGLTTRLVVVVIVGRAEFADAGAVGCS